MVQRVQRNLVKAPPCVQHILVKFPECHFLATEVNHLRLGPVFSLVTTLVSSEFRFQNTISVPMILTHPHVLSSIGVHVPERPIISKVTFGILEHALRKV